jgi:hypothetical protein
MMSAAAAIQEKHLARNAADEGVYQDLFFFHAAKRALDKIGALSPDLDPANETDLLVFELFQGTEPQALLALADPEDAPWIRYSLMKAFLHKGETEKALAFWKKILQWQVPDTLVANTLLQYALREGRFEEAGNIAAVSLKVASKQRDVLFWKAMAQSKRTLDAELYLDPLPKQLQVSLAICSAPQSDIPAPAEVMLAIATQNSPLAEVLYLMGSDARAWSEARDLQPRVVTHESGQYWISAAISASATPLLVTVPPGRVPTFDYVQQFVLAAENAAPGWALAAGRIEDLHQDKPGDCWRAARLSRTFSMERTTDFGAIDSEVLCVDCDALRPVLDATCTDVQSIARTADARDFTGSYLPEAVALDLRSDDIQSALEFYWEQDLPRRKAAGHFDSATALVASLSEHRERSTTFMNRSMAEGNSILIFPDFLLFFESTVLDLHHGVASGLFDEATAGIIQDRLIESMAVLDESFKRGLRAKVRLTLGPLLFAGHTDAPLPADVDRTLDCVLKELATLFRAFPQDLYLALIG